MFDSAVADWQERAAVGGTITFTVIGLILGASGFGANDLSLNTDALGTLAQLTMAILLFVDTATPELIAVACMALMSIIGNRLSTKPLARLLPGRLAAEGAPTARDR